jgi:hypothetical protein
MLQSLPVKNTLAYYGTNDDEKRLTTPTAGASPTAETAAGTISAITRDATEKIGGHHRS